MRGDGNPLASMTEMDKLGIQASGSTLGRNVNVSALTEVYATCTITLCTDTGIDTGGNKRHIQWRRESVCGIARCCVRIVGHCRVVRRTERDRPARLGQDQRT